MFLFALVLLSARSFAQQQCSDGGIGLCVGDICPTGFTCLDDKLPTETCCDNTKVFTPTTLPPTTLPPATIPPTTASPATTCVDKINPNTGTSDCPMRIQYCQNSIYYDLMTDQCPLTCNRCPGSTTGGTNCVDKINPKTGTSDCLGMASYCSNSIYYDLMTDQCPLTCSRCTGSTTTGGTTCVDKINSNTGTSDCPMRAYLCSQSIYYDLMSDQCPKTCARCSTSSTNIGSSNTGNVGTQTTSCVDKINPNTGTSDCPMRANLCSDPVYYSLMLDQCPKTCGTCSG